MLFYFLSGVTVGLTAGISPGPVFALMISETFQHGRSAGIKVAISPLFTDLPIILLCIFFIRIISSIDHSLPWITIAGGFYLIYLGFDCFRSKTYNEPWKGTNRSLKKGIITNFLNPAPYMFWFSVGASSLISMWTLNKIYPALYITGFYGCLVGSKILIVFLADKTKNFIGLNLMNRVRIVMGILMIALGIKFFIDAAAMFGYF